MYPVTVSNHFSEDNFQRQVRAIELARQKGCHPMVIASAYVLGQELPVFALVGPATLEESARTFAVLDVVLSEEEIRWRNIED